MTDKQLTDNEIKKALECCSNDCCKAECFGYFMTGTNECTTLLAKNALDLINRLQAQIEKLEKVEHFADKTIATLQAENERLQEPRMVNIVHARSLGKTFSIYGALYREAYKECIENVKKLRANYQGYDFDRELDNLLKEMEGEDK